MQPIAACPSCYVRCVCRTRHSHPAAAAPTPLCLLPSHPAHAPVVRVLWLLINRRTAPAIPPAKVSPRRAVPLRRAVEAVVAVPVARRRLVAPVGPGPGRWRPAVATVGGLLLEAAMLRRRRELAVVAAIVRAGSVGRRRAVELAVVAAAKRRVEACILAAPAEGRPRRPPRPRGQPPATLVLVPGAMLVRLGQRVLLLLLLLLLRHRGGGGERRELAQAQRPWLLPGRRRRRWPAVRPASLLHERGAGARLGCMPGVRAAFWFAAAGPAGAAAGAASAAGLGARILLRARRTTSGLSATAC